MLGILARRYADRVGMVWEIWNEPNHPEFWGNGSNAADYTGMLQRSYVAVKVAAPTTTVLGGSIVFNALKFLRGMYENGAKVSTMA